MLDEIADELLWIDVVDATERLKEAARRVREVRIKGQIESLERKIRKLRESLLEEGP